MPDGRSVPPPDNFYPLRDWVRDELRSRIGLGQLRAGQRLIETSLAEEFEVSRLPVREALRALEVEGLVTKIPRHGLVVTELTREDIAHLYDVRAVLEPLAFRLAAERASNEDKRALKDLVDQAAAHATAGQHAETVRSNSLFHQEVIRVARNPFLASALEPLSGRLQWLIGHGYEHERDIGEHRALSSAITAGDGAEAARLTADHIEASRKHGLDNFDRQSDDNTN